MLRNGPLGIALSIACVAAVSKAHGSTAMVQDDPAAAARQCEERARPGFSCAGAWSEAADKAWEDGRWDVARDAKRRAMQWRATHGESDPAIDIMDLQDLAVIEANAGNLKAARDLLIDAIERRRVLKQGIGIAPNLFALGMNLAAVLRDLGEWTASEDALNVAIASAGGFDRIHAFDRATVYLARARTAEYLGQLKEAEAYWRRCIETATGMVGGAYVLERRVNLAANLNMQGRFDEAIVLATGIEGAFAARFPNAPHRVSNLNNLAFALNGEGRFSAAVEGYRKALRLAEANIAFRPSSLEDIRLNLAVALGDSGDAAAGVKLARGVFARTRIGSEEPDLPTRAAIIVGALSRQTGDFAASLAHYRQAALRAFEISHSSAGYDRYSAAARRSYRRAWTGLVATAWASAQGSR